ncbi:hypothetical protein FGB62_201g016 [Gracilaria domingensis]|nr:hypothetical protein FGB62_201g016 [Gracilaria domingensis]
MTADHATSQSSVTREQTNQASSVRSLSSRISRTRDNSSTRTDYSPRRTSRLSMAYLDAISHDELAQITSSLVSNELKTMLDSVVKKAIEDADKELNALEQRWKIRATRALTKRLKLATEIVGNLDFENILTKEIGDSDRDIEEEECGQENE